MGRAALPLLLRRELLRAGSGGRPLGKLGGSGNKDDSSVERGWFGHFLENLAIEYLSSVGLQVQLKKFFRGENCAGLCTAAHLSQHKCVE